jgi:hypothetical protein
VTARRSTHIALILGNAEEESLWLGAFRSQGMAAEALAMTGDLDSVLSDPRIASAGAVMLDEPLLALRGTAPAAFAALLLARYPRIALFVRLPARPGIAAPEQAWARHVGIASLLPGSSIAAWQDSFATVLSRVMSTLGRPGVDSAKLEAYVTGLMKTGAEPRPGPIKDTYIDAYHLETAGVNAVRLLDAMQGENGVAVADRAWRGRTYRECFVASEAVDWLVARFGMRRTLAAKACTFLWRTGRIHHVLREAAFDDDFLFFRFSGRRSELDRIDLVQVEAAMRSKNGVPVAERTHLGKLYPRCFVGSDAVDWLMACCALRLGAAEAIGQRLLDLGVLHHVLDEHGFVEGKFFYRFRADEVAILA